MIAYTLETGIGHKSDTRQHNPYDFSLAPLDIGTRRR